MGEGGSVNIVRNQKLKVIAESFGTGAATAGALVEKTTHATRG